MSDKWGLREYQFGDEVAILAVRKAVFDDVEPEKMSLDFWNWEFKESPCGQAIIALAYLKENGLVIGQHAGLRSHFKVYDDYVVAVLGCDSMTMPGHRYPWMFLSIMEYAFNIMKEQGVLFHYGFPYRRGIPELSKASGMRDMFDVPILVKPVDFTKLCNHYIKKAFISNICGPCLKMVYKIFFTIRMYRQQKQIKIDEIVSFDSSFDLLWGKVATQFNIIQKRDKLFLEWRFVSNPAKKYQIYKALIDGETVGYAVSCVAELFGLKCLILCDIIAVDFDKDILKALAVCLEENARDKNVDLIALMMNNENPYYSFFISEGYIKSPFAFKYTMISFLDKLNTQDLSSKDFYLTWADSDTM